MDEPMTPTALDPLEGPRLRFLGRSLPLDRPLVRALAGTLSLGLPLVALSAIVVILLGPTEQQVTQTFLISLVAVVGFQVYSGNSGIITFGHVAFMGIGAYASGLLTVPAVIKATALPNLAPFLQSVELPLLLATPVALVVVLAVAFLFGLPLSRLAAAATPIATLAMLIITYVVLVGAADVTRGSQTFYGVPPDVTLPIALAVALAAIFTARLFRESVPGLRVRAAREDELAARSTGVDVRNLRLAAWLLSAVIVGVAGILLGHTLTAFSPKQFYFTLQFALVAMLVVGGPTTVTGAVGGAVVVSLLMELARRIEGALHGASIGGFEIAGVFGLQEITLGVLILLAMYRRRDGLFGRVELDEMIRRRLDRRRPGRPGSPAAPPVQGEPGGST
jgi:branched-chain amino acid transport system permease protein